MGGRPHALLIPGTARGHWHPVRDLMLRLMNSRQDMLFTVLGGPLQISELQAMKENGAFDTLDDVQFIEAFTGIGKGKQTWGVATQMRDDFLGRPSIMQKLAAQKASGCGPTFIVADMFLFWTQDIADELGIPRYTFITSPTTFALMVLHAPAVAEKYKSKRLDPSKRDMQVNLPGLEIFRLSDVPDAVLDLPEAYKIHSKFFLKAAGILVNSFLSYEAEEVTALRDQLGQLVSDGQKRSVFLLGPVRSPSENESSSPDQKGEEPLGTKISACLRFLNTRPATSVLYICFGSHVELPQSHITQIAQGLERSEASFLWILPRPVEALASWNVSQVLPAGFESRTNGRGIIWTDWAPQNDILHHPSVGGFITHCGWNSLLEAICAGVPIIPWPVQAEQKMNARFITSVANAGIEMRKNSDGEFIGEEIARAIRLLMISDEGRKQREKMRSLRNAALAAVGKDGSSEEALRAFLQEAGGSPSG